MSLPTLYQQYIHKSRYARWLPKEGRRETWEETVDRYMTNVVGETKNFDITSIEDYEKLRQAIINLEVMPSMRCLMTAGPALDRDNVAGFNCAYVAIEEQRAFDEILYILMCGTGVGFSVERQSITKLPFVADTFENTDTVIRVADSKEGWAKGFRELVSLLYSGRVPQWDLSKLRPAGAPLKTFGGRSSGPEPLDALFRFTVETFLKAAGRKLTSVECHDIVCKIAQIVVVGGVRRSALISLSNLSDDRMRSAKTGQWWENNSQRALANNSAVYAEKPDVNIFMQEWLSLYESKSGERGIFSRVASQKQAETNGRRDPNHEFGTNPCSEIILRSKQFCNLSEVVVRSDDNLDDLKEKVRLATIAGTIQATYTNFRYLSKKWKHNTEEEALLGVSLTGIMDHPVLNGRELPVTTQSDGYMFHKNGWDNVFTLEDVLEVLRSVAVETNKEWAEKLGINQSTAITCVKPSGTVSQLVDSASGIHPRFSKYYLRRVRSDKKDPLSRVLIDAGVHAEDDVMNQEAFVFTFPVKAPENAVVTSEVSAIDQLKLWEKYQRHWCEHKPSVTVYYGDDEFMELGAWVYDNFDALSGVSFLPRTDHIYQQAPYEPIDYETYQEWEAMYNEKVEIDWDLLQEYEEQDNTTASQELACVGTNCEL